MSQSRAFLACPLRRLRAPAALLAVLVITACSTAPSYGPEVAAPDRVLASWVVRVDLLSKRSVDRVLSEATAGGFNTLVVQIRGRGDAYFASHIEPPPSRLQGSGFDPLKRLLVGARNRGIRVHGWVNANLVWDPEDPNPDPRHVVHAHPEWLSLPMELARDLLALPPERAPDPMLKFVQAHRNEVEGLYGEATNPDYRSHVARVCSDILQRYPLDGIHLDYIRYPNVRWGYSRRALDIFRMEVDGDLNGADRRDMASRLQRDPLVYTRRYPVRWNSFRRQGVNLLVKAVAAASRRASPGVEITAAVFPDAAIARTKVLQDWPLWLKEGWLDVACPMNYTTDRKLFERRSQDIMTKAEGHRVWIGVGAWKLDLEQTTDRIGWLFERPVQGVVLFSQGGLRSQPNSFSVLKSAFTAGRLHP